MLVYRNIWFQTFSDHTETLRNLAPRLFWHGRCFKGRPERAMAPEGKTEICGSDWGQEWVKVKGVVVPHAWDQDGRILQIAIAGSDEREYPVKREGRGRELESMLHRPVEVVGKIISGEGGSREIVIVEVMGE
jgi:hypothetical protein